MDGYVDDDELIGKTIERVVNDDGIMFRFTDGTFTKIGYSHGYYAGEGDVEFIEIESEYELYRLGFISEEAWQAKQAKEKAEREERYKRERQRQYEQLKREFEK